MARRTASERLAAAQTKAATAEATLRAALAGRAAKRVMALESRIDPDNPNNKRRREAKVEIHGEDKRLTQRQRYRGANVGRELHRETSRYRTFETQWAANVVGTGPKLSIHWADKEAGKLAADWFNQRWAPACDQRDDNHLADFAELALLTVIREGECLAVFDDFRFNDGALTFYESDQLPTLDPGKWKLWAVDPAQRGLFVELDYADPARPVPFKGPDGKAVPLTLVPGRIVNRYGRVVYYVADEQHGRAEVDPADPQLSYLSRNVAKLLKAPWRFNQLVGQSEALAIAGDLEDLDAMRAAECASARKACERAYVVHGRDAYEQELARAGIDAESLVDDAGTDPAPGKVATLNMDRLERYADGYVDYIGENEKITELGTNRPNVQTATFHESVGGQAGAALGLSAVYATLRAAASYTAFRGEMLMGWRTFYRRQKWLERRFLDWVAIKAIAWAVRTGRLKVALSDGWEYALSWTMPRMPEVDELKAVNATAKRLKNGLTTYGELLGPEAMDRLTALAAELDFIRGALPELELLETKAGAPTAAADDGNGDSPDNNGDDE